MKPRKQPKPLWVSIYPDTRPTTDPALDTHLHANPDHFRQALKLMDAGWMRLLWIEEDMLMVEATLPCEELIDTILDYLKVNNRVPESLVVVNLRNGQPTPIPLGAMGRALAQMQAHESQAASSPIEALYVYGLTTLPIDTPELLPSRAILTGPMETLMETLEAIQDHRVDLLGASANQTQQVSLVLGLTLNEALDYSAKTNQTVAFVEGATWVGQAWTGYGQGMRSVDFTDQKALQAVFS